MESSPWQTFVALLGALLKKAKLRSDFAYVFVEIPKAPKIDRHVFQMSWPHSADVRPLKH